METDTALAGAAAMLLAAAMIAVPPAVADDMTEIDCSSSPFSFTGEGFHVDCERSTDQVRAGESSGGTQVDVMTISADDPRMFMTIVSIKINAPRIYMEYRALGQSFRNTFQAIEAEEWEGKGNRNGYDSAEFKTEISGVSSWCVAIQRYTNPAWTGYKRHIIGMGCSPTSREAVYAALAKLQAPGD